MFAADVNERALADLEDGLRELARIAGIVRVWDLPGEQLIQELKTRMAIACQNEEQIEARLRKWRQDYERRITDRDSRIRDLEKALQSVARRCKKAGCT